MMISEISALQAGAFQVTSPAPREVWQNLMNNDPEALPYQSPQWLDAMSAADDYEDASRYYEMSGGQQLVMPMVRRKGLPAKLSPMASQPHGWGMGGLVAAKPVQAEQVTAVFNDLLQQPNLRISIRPNPRDGELWAEACPKNVIKIPRLAHTIDLEGGFDKVWTQRFTKRTRKIIRKAERDGRLVVESDSSGRLLPVFYDLLLLSFDRWAKQQHEPRLLTHLRGRRRDSLDKFQLIAKHLGKACHVWVVWLDGQPAAASLVLQYGNVNDARGAMDKELVGQTGANYLLQKLSIEEACRSGCRYYHLGESGSSAGLAHYKSRFGAQAFAYEEYHIERLPITTTDARIRGIVKKLIGFKDA